MPTTTSYPGIYIEELPSTERTIAAAPTSITVFIGYTHPYKTARFGAPVRVFSFAEYERNFGGFFRSDRTPPWVPWAAHQFFLNGGSDAYVVGLQPSTPLTPASHAMPNGTTSPRLVFTAVEPTDVTPMSLTIRNVSGSTTEADITVTYGTRAESHRRVPIAEAKNRLAGTDASSLVKVTEVGGTPAAYTEVTNQVLQETAGTSVFSAGHFTPVFATDGLLDKVDIFNILAIPGVSDASVLANALAFCERKQAFYVMDPPANATADAAGTAIADLVAGSASTVPKSANGAIYFPYLNSTDPATGNTVPMPPSGFVTGIYARTDNNRGVWKAPAGLEAIVNNTTGVPPTGMMTDPRAGVINLAGVNAIRTFAGVGSVVFGARTLVSPNVAFQQWKYVPVRRMALFLEQTLKRNLGWVIFEPNDEPLWLTIRTSIEAFMLSLFRQAAFQGSTPSQAFLVKCDSSTTTQQDINNGVVNIVVGFRPLKPAEFVIIKIAQLAGQVQS